MLPLLPGAAGLVLVVVLLSVLFRRRRWLSLLRAVRAIPAPMLWERTFWRGPAKRGGSRG